MGEGVSSCPLGQVGFIEVVTFEPYLSWAVLGSRGKVLW